MSRRGSRQRGRQPTAAGEGDPGPTRRASHSGALARAHTTSRKGTSRRGWPRSATATTSGRTTITVRYATANGSARSSMARGSVTAMIRLANMVPTTTAWMIGCSGSYRLVIQAVCDQINQSARKSSRVRPNPVTSAQPVSSPNPANRCETRVRATTKARSKNSSRNVARPELARRAQQFGTPPRRHRPPPSAPRYQRAGRQRSCVNAHLVSGVHRTLLSLTRRARG